MSHAQLRWAAARARELGCPLDRVLICQGLVTEEHLYRALARGLGADFVLHVSGVPLGDYRREAVMAGCVRVGGASGRPEALLVAPEGEAFERLVRSAHGFWWAGSRLLVTTPRALRAWILAHHARMLANEAAYHLQARMPEMSSRQVASRPQILLALLAVVGLSFAFALDPIAASRLLCLLLGPVFAVAAWTRVISALRGQAIPAPVAPVASLADRWLPAYTVLAALHREAEVVPHFVRALSAIDYPPEKMSVRIILEADDRSTLAALRACDLPPWFEIVLAPAGEPRTKPRALNFALPSMGEGLVTVFDAEDRPDPGQLRHAASAFAAAGPEIACLQARLVVDNAGDHWLTRCFALEYAALFDRVIPGLARLRLPVCLGGTSNHFRGIRAESDHVGSYPAALK